jgi:hypothetical protein
MTWPDAVTILDLLIWLAIIAIVGLWWWRLGGSNKLADLCRIASLSRSTDKLCELQ